MKNLSTYYIFLILLCGQIGIAQKAKLVHPKFELPKLESFNEGKAKSQIIDFVKNAVNKNSNEYIKPEDRIACFDNDGTLWCEQPLPAQAYFAFDRIKQLSKDHPEWTNLQPFKSVLENDFKTLTTLSVSEIFKLIATAESSLNVDDFDQIVNEWIKTSKHPKYGIPFNQLVYQPMLEVIEYLKLNGFKVFIVSGGSTEFMRAWAPRTYGILKENVIGSTMKLEAVQFGDSIVVKRLPELEFNDDHFGKVISIEKYIGKKPVIVFGNSDGDLEMMEYSYFQQKPKLMVYVKHTDNKREYYYDEHTSYGRLVKGEMIAKKYNWTIIDMQKDWKSVFKSN